VSQQVDGAIPNAAQFGGQYDAVKRTLAFGPDRFDEHAELVCKRDKSLFDKIASQFLVRCGSGHCHNSSMKRMIAPRARGLVFVLRRVGSAVESILPSRSASDHES
jgi:hypothetical protein